MSVTSRIQQFIDIQGISKRKFDEKISQSDGYISKQIRANASIGSDVLEKICALFPDLNPIWLLTGREEMLVARKQSLETENQKLKESVNRLQQELEDRSKLISHSLEVVDIRNQRIAELEKQLANQSK